MALHNETCAVIDRAYRNWKLFGAGIAEQSKIRGQQEVIREIHEFFPEKRPEYHKARVRLRGQLL